MQDNKIVAMDGHHGMTQEHYDQVQRDEYLQSLPGNIDNVKLVDEPTAKQSSLPYLIEALGHARAATTSCYEAYKEVKAIEDQVRYELELKLRETGLRSAKGATFTASISEKPSIVINNESAAIEWVKNFPDLEADFYIGLKTTEFKNLASSLLKGTGEIPDGCSVEVKESLSIRNNKKAA